MNKLLMISQTAFPPDIRLEKEIKSLSEAGYRILVVCNQYDKTKNPIFDYCDIIRVKALFKSVKLNRIFNFPIFINPRYLITVFSSIIKFKPKFLHAHDLPMMPIAIFFGKIFRIPIIFDMHENYPEALRAFQKKGIFNFIFKNYRLAKILEKICLRFTDRIIVVIEENRKRLINEKYIKPEIIFVVSNTIDISTFNNSRTEVNNFEIENDIRDIILYTGTISADRGLLTAIQSSFYYEELGIYPLIQIVGDGSYKNYLKDYVKKNKLNDFVHFIDWPGHKKIPLYIQKAKICMIPQPNNDFINTTIPHKLFEYMFMEKPVLVSNAIPLERIVKETNSGLVFKSEVAKDFAEKIKVMLTSKVNWGETGKKAVLNKFNWNVDSKELLRVYHSFNFASKII